MVRRKKLLVLLGIVVLVAVVLVALPLAQLPEPRPGPTGHGTIKGTVAVAGGGPLEGASVVLECTIPRVGECVPRFATTDSNGQFAFTGLGILHYWVTVTDVKYGSQNQGADIRTDTDVVDLRFDLVKLAIYDRCEHDQGLTAGVSLLPPSMAAVAAAVVLVVGLWKGQGGLRWIAVVAGIALAVLALLLVVVWPMPAYEEADFPALAQHTWYSRALGSAVSRMTDVPGQVGYMAEVGADYSGGYSLYGSPVLKVRYTSTSALLGYLQGQRAACQVTDAELRWFGMMLGGPVS